MKQMRLTLNVLAILAVGLFCSTFAQAQATRTWVSGVGDDANPCSRTAPCKTFAGAISKTAAGGEINCLDPGGFGGVTLTKSITIDCRMTEGGLLAANTNGVIINALTTDKIVLRGLDINGGGGAGGLDGIRFLAGGSLHIEDSQINNMTTAINVGLNQTATAEVYVKNTYIRNNSTLGVFLSNAGAGTVVVTIEKSTIENNAFGIIGRNNTRATIHDSVISGNTNNGILAEVQSGAVTAEINVDSCIVTGNGTGLSSGTNAVANQGILRVSNTFISHNGTGVTAGNGMALSFGDNKLQGNTAPGAFTAGTLGKN